MLDALEGFSNPGPIKPDEGQRSACRRGYYDYLLHGPEYAVDYKRALPRCAWHYLTGVTAARRGTGLAAAMRTLTLAHVPGASYTRQDGFKSSNPFIRIRG